jgi:hypothetical protein
MLNVGEIMKLHAELSNTHLHQQIGNMVKGQLTVIVSQELFILTVQYP